MTVITITVLDTDKSDRILAELERLEQEEIIDFPFNTEVTEEDDREIEYFLSLSDETLSQYYANSYHTGCCAGGHGKGERNLKIAKFYKTEIKRRGLPIPEGKGIFNGEGSS